MTEKQWVKLAIVAMAAVLIALAACGSNDDGGEGGPLEPGLQPAISGFRTGGNSTCASLEEDGTAYCWGANEFGQVGDGTTTDRHRPTRAGSIAHYFPPLAGDHACSQGATELYCWGRNSSGEVGTGSTSLTLTPTLVPGGLAFQAVAVGDDFTCGIAGSGTTYCWGANDRGQLGTGTPGNSPIPIAVAGQHTFTVIRAAGRTVCALTNTSELYCWGNGADGELGNGAFNSSASVPTIVGGGLHVLDVGVGANQAGQATVCAMAFEGPYCWGKNSSGEIGDGTKVRKSIPTAVGGLTGDVQFAPAGSHTCARSPLATVYCWGKGGRLGNGNSQESLSPVLVTGVQKFSYIWSGRDHTCGVSDVEPRLLYCWGENSRGQLGDGTTSARVAPTQVVF